MRITQFVSVRVGSVTRLIHAIGLLADRIGFLGLVLLGEFNFFH